MPFTMTLGVGLGDLIPVGRMPRSWRSWASPRLILKVVVQLALFLLGGASVIDTDGRGVPPYLKAQNSYLKYFAGTELCQYIYFHTAKFSLIWPQKGF